MDTGEVATKLGAKLKSRLGEAVVRLQERNAEVMVDIEAANVDEVCLALRDAPEFAFEQLIDLCGVDYSVFGQADWETSETATSSGFSRGVERGGHAGAKWEGGRFAVVYQLLSISRNERVRVRVMLKSEPPRVSSVVPIWNSAEWYEREAFDLYGILFEGHPDLRRILTDYGFIGHPFRKDFPLTGQVEMRYDPEKSRVVYEPVSVEPRTLVPRVIRHDARYHVDGSHAADDEAGEA